MSRKLIDPFLLYGFEELNFSPPTMPFWNAKGSHLWIQSFQLGRTLANLWYDRILESTWWRGCHDAAHPAQPRDNTAGQPAGMAAWQTGTKKDEDPFHHWFFYQTTFLTLALLTWLSVPCPSGPCRFYCFSSLLGSASLLLSILMSQWTFS